MPSGGLRTRALQRDTERLTKEGEQKTERLVANLTRQYGPSIVGFARLWAQYIVSSPTAAGNYRKVVKGWGDIFAWIAYEEKRKPNKRDSFDELSFIGDGRRNLLRQMKEAARACPIIANAPRPQKRKKVLGIF